MLTDPFGLPQDYAAASDVLKNAAVISMQGTQVTRSFTANTSNGDPKFMKISHNTAGKGSAVRERHLVRLEAFAVVGGVEDRSKPIVMYTVIDVPKSEAGSSTTLTTVQTLSAYMSGFLRGRGPGATGVNPNYQYVTRILAGES